MRSTRGVPENTLDNVLVTPLNDIDKTGKVAAIDTAVRPETSAEDMLAKLEALKVAKKG